MPRAPRRAVVHAHDAVVTTPTRPTTTNTITAAIPPFMLETPPHAPFLTTPLPPSNNPGALNGPDGYSQRAQHASGPQQTPTANGIAPNHAPENPQISSNALGSAISEGGHADEQSFLESVPHDAEDAKQLQGLRDISSLATWTLSSAKPGCALAQLRHPSPAHFWQSDGPQPHTLTLHFFKLVAIVKMRIYLDFELDESYTPTKMKFFAGMSEGGLVEFGSWEVTETTDPDTGETHSSIEGVRGWIDIPLKGVGGRETHDPGNINVDQVEDEADVDRVARGIKSRKKRHQSLANGLLPDTSVYGLGDTEMDDFAAAADVVGGDVLKAMVVQVRICENHQNGKDTHVRGFQVFARDEVGVKELRKVVRKGKRANARQEEDEAEEQIVGLQPADWMGDPEIR